ncbi:MAG TPA: endonuclease/exonuclease/phosphatase family protein [Elusimicrobiota bacterium]|nr:endonuclease/exonuclease/phosphatase family protein [Elusimicrobiota bacterium]
MRFRLLTYNIHKGVGGLDRRYDLPRIAETIAHYAPDAVLLQEVTDSAPHSGQALALAKLLSYRHMAYVPHTKRWLGSQYGNAIFSRYPIAETGHIDLTVPPKKRRGALHARIRARLPSGRSRTLHVFNLHLGLSGIERRIQLRRFLERSPFAHLHARAAIAIAGDFNDVWGTLGKNILAPAGFHGTPRLPTFPAFAPLRALDSIYIRGDVRMVHDQRGNTALARVASDHLPLIADLEIE